MEENTNNAEEVATPTPLAVEGADAPETQEQDVNPAETQESGDTTVDPAIGSEEINEPVEDAPVDTEAEQELAEEVKVGSQGERIL
jgi:hypothetical protein